MEDDDDELLVEDDLLRKRAARLAIEDDDEDESWLLQLPMLIRKSKLPSSLSIRRTFSVMFMKLTDWAKWPVMLCICTACVGREGAS